MWQCLQKQHGYPVAVLQSCNIHTRIRTGVRTYVRSCMSLFPPASPTGRHTYWQAVGDSDKLGKKGKGVYLI